MELDEASDDKTVSASAGQQIVIRLKGNPTTGYTWGEPAITGEAVPVVRNYHAAFAGYDVRGDIP